MPRVELTDATFARLQRLAVPLVDSIETVVEKLINAYEQDHQEQPNGRKPVQTAVHPRQFDASSPPELKHAKLLSAKLNGRALKEAKWNGLLVEAIRLAKAGARTDDELRRLVPVNFVLKRKEDEGYRFFADIGMSVQGQDANSAWKGAYHIAQQLGIDIEAEFQWRAKDRAAYPGVTGRLSA
jgi:hypothetical protein